MIGTMISLLALGASLVFSTITLWRSAKKDAAKSVEQMATIIVKLETISCGVTEIRADMRSVKAEIRDHEARLIKLEEQLNKDRRGMKLVGRKEHLPMAEHIIN